MANTLFIHACPRPGSRTMTLAQAVVEHLGGADRTLDLFADTPAPLDGAALAQRQALCDAGDFDHPMFRFAREFAQADTVVLAAPFWDLLFPAVVRSYLEAITVSGLTFRYTPQGFPQGLCRAQRLVYVTTAGGPMGPNDFGFRYVEAVARGFFSIPDVRCVSAQGLDIVGSDPQAILNAAIAAIPQTLA